MPQGSSDAEEHDMPCIEAMLASTMVLMTGYCQSLQAAQHPLRRIHLGCGIDATLKQLAAHPQLSDGFRDALAGLRRRWARMTECAAAGISDAVNHQPAAFAFSAPEQLQ